jgi:hypothetical protein
MVAGLAFGEEHDQWSPQLVADRVELGVQPALGAPDVDLPRFSGERLAHFLPCPLELDRALEAER